MPSELREALNAATASAFVQKIIDPVLLEYQRRYSPLVTALPRQQWTSDQYYFNQRTTVANGGFVTDGGAQPVSNSAYVQNNFQMKHLQVVGAVTGYSQEVTRAQIGDLRETEIEGSIRGLTWDTETGVVWGNSASTLNGAHPQFDGLDTQVSSFSGSTQNAFDNGGGTLSLATLDTLLDMVESNAAMSIFDDQWMFVMSGSANSKIAQLQTSQQRYLDKVEVAVGLLVPTYRDVPIVKSSFLASRGFAMSAVTATPTATTPAGNIASGVTYHYMVSAVVARQGEILACADVSATTAAASSSIVLTFTPPSGFEGSQPITYKVYRGSSSSNQTLLGYVDATVGLQADGVTPVVTNTIVDNGAALIPMNGGGGGTAPGVTPTVYFGTNTGLKPPTTAGYENLYLLSRDRNNVVRPFVREFRPLDVYPTTSAPDTLPYALVSDTCLALRAPKYAGRVTNVAIGTGFPNA